VPGGLMTAHDDRQRRHTRAGRIRRDPHSASHRLIDLRVAQAAAWSPRWSWQTLLCITRSCPQSRSGTSRRRSSWHGSAAARTWRCSVSTACLPPGSARYLRPPAAYHARARVYRGSGPSAGTSVHTRALSGIAGEPLATHVDGENPANRPILALPGDHFPTREPVTDVPVSYPEAAPALPGKANILQMGLKPTPGLEPGTPSLRGKDE
jgi:hypothetical protein